MKYHNTNKTKGFSLVEMLVVIAVIGILATIAVGALSGTNEQAKEAKSKRNAQNICMLYNSARAVSAPFTDTTDEDAIVADLIAGVTGVDVMSRFQLSPLSSEEITAALAHCTLDTAADRMEYSPDSDGSEAQQPDDGAEWTEWMYLTYGYSAQNSSDLLNQFNQDYTSGQYQFRISPTDPVTLEYRENMNFQYP